MAKTSIEWTDMVWNPVTGCSPVSEGCRNCYAARIASRFGKEGESFEGLAESGKWTGKITLHPERLNIPLHRKKPTRFFVNSMSDLFHPEIPVSFIIEVFEVMAACPQHTFQVLTKRPERIGPVLYGEEGRWYLGGGDSIPNVWLGFSAEDQETFDVRAERIESAGWTGLIWVSLEPLLGSVDISRYLKKSCWSMRLGWIVVGGESGTSARPMHPYWVRSIRDCCQAAGIPFFFKQWGEWAQCDDPQEVLRLRNRAFEILPGHLCFKRVGKKAAGCLLDGRTWDEFPKRA